MNLCLIIPTHNRPECIENYLEKKAQIFKENDIDIVIFDTSDNDSTMKIAIKYAQCYNNVKYDRYMGPVEQNAIDYKVAAACKQYAPLYEYLLFSSDSTIINVEKLVSIAERGVTEYFDFLVYDNGSRALELNNDCRAVLTEYSWRMTSLSSTLFSSKFLLDAMKTFSVTHVSFKGLWLMAVVFFQIANVPFLMIYLTDENLWTVNKARKESFWVQSKNALWQWGQVWCEVIDSLPSIYDLAKTKTLLSHDEHTQLFSIRGLLRMKSTGNLTYKKVREFSQYCPRVTKTKITWFYLIAVLPIQKILQYCRKIYQSIKKQGKGE